MHRVRSPQVMILMVLVMACTIIVNHRFFNRSETVAAAAAITPQYKVVRIDGEINAQALQNEINEIAAQGWELQTVITPLTGGGGFSNLIFRKRA